MPGWKMASREDLEQNMLKERVVRKIDTWGIVKIANGGKLDGSGYGSKIHDTHGPECCSKALWIRGEAEEPEEVEVDEVVEIERPAWNTRDS